MIEIFPLSEKHLKFEDVGKNPRSFILWSGVQVTMKSLKDKDELFGAIQAIRNPEVRKPMTPMRRHNPLLNNQTTIKLPIDPTSDDTEFLLPLGDPDPVTHIFNLLPDHWYD